MNFDNMGSFVADVVDGATQLEKRCTTGLKPKVIEALLHGLGHDDAFRALFAHDPRAALATIGHESSPATLGVVGVDPVMCLNGNNLASKEAIRAASDKLRRELEIFGPFQCPVV
jgi:putative modified peptide